MEAERIHRTRITIPSAADGSAGYPMDRARFRASLVPVLVSVALWTGLACGRAARSPDESAIVRVTVGAPAKSYGSGFFVDDHHVVTNLHVLKGALPGPNAADAFISVEGDESQVAIVGYDSRRDLALLRYDGERRPGKLSLAPDGALPRGTAVVALGYPRQSDRFGRAASSTPKYGQTNTPPTRRKLDSQPPVAFDATLVQHQAFLDRGSSGSALLDTCNQVVGVNTYGLPMEDGTGIVAGFYGAVYVSELRHFLSESRVTYSTGGPCVAGQPAFFTPLFAGALMAFTVIALLLLRRPGAIAPAAADPNPGRMPLATAEAPTGIFCTVRFTAQSGGRDLSLDMGTLQAARFGFSVGRDADMVDRALLVEGLSRRHFRVAVREGQTYIEDLQSTNGTFVNGARLTPYGARRLGLGDAIAAGGARWTFSGLDPSSIRPSSSTGHSPTAHRVLTIGRSADADIQMDDDSLSRVHAELAIARDAGRLCVTDRSSANGTWLDAGGEWERIAQRQVAFTDRLRLGSVEVEVAELLRRASRR